jgi:hypothetical protein
MTKWPLRWKVALYSALLAVGATFGGAITTWFLLRQGEIAAFDRGLTTDAQEFFRDVEHFEGGRRNNRQVFNEIFVPLSLRRHLFLAMTSKNFTITRSTATTSAWRSLVKMALLCAPATTSQRSIESVAIFYWQC